MIKLLQRLAITGLALILCPQASATADDVQHLVNKVEQQVQLISQAGILPTSLEIEVITGDIVNNEVLTTDLTVDQASQKYQLVPTLQRYIQIKAAARDLVTNGSGNGAGIEPG
jgi:4-hydroxy-3-methylbut-2-en-1-yl diphosphate synthase IspG/GcpE